VGFAVSEMSTPGGAALWGHPQGAVAVGSGVRVYSCGCHPCLFVCVILCLCGSCLCLGEQDRSHTFILMLF